MRFDNPRRIWFPAVACLWLSTCSALIRTLLLPACLPLMGAMSHSLLAAEPVTPEAATKVATAADAQAQGGAAEAAQVLERSVELALVRSGSNRPQIQTALQDVPAEQRESMQFLVANMPERDLQRLSAQYLLNNVRLAHDAWDQASWKTEVPREIFLNDVLPYASINERRDDWRADFQRRFQPLVADAKSPSEAAALLNQKIFPLLNVRYSTQRRRADQSPLESIETGLASCTGLSVLLIDACRAVGVPARFVGTPLWSDGSGNHSWVEIWDKGWHFTGAAEPDGNELDKAWFVARASQARWDDPAHAIYAVSFRKTPLVFPLVWQRDHQQVYAVNVTSRYTRRAEPLPDGFVRVMFRVLDRVGGPRQAATLDVLDNQGQVASREQARDERFDANDHTVLTLKQGEKYTVQADYQGRRANIALAVNQPDELVTLILPDKSEAEKPEAEKPKAEVPKAEVPKAEAPKAEAPKATSTSAQAVADLQAFLERPETERGELETQPFAKVPLAREDSDRARKLLWSDHAGRIRLARAEEMEQRRLKLDDLEMPFDYTVFGEKPVSGRSLYLSLHGGGGAPKRVNDQQWENQKRLYRPAEGVYLAPRAPTDTWNLWHQPHVDTLFDRLIENLIVFEDVDPQRVYVMGYSAGGDGVYQLAPRMADRWAAAAMMAGHPNDASPLSLRNTAFTLHVGGQDAAYNRNQVAGTWKEKLDELRKNDPEGYENWVEIYPDKGHWMDRQDAAAVPWMAKFGRRTLPDRIVWKQDDVTHGRFYWLSVSDQQRKAGSQAIATRDGQRIDVQTEGIMELTIRLDDRMLDLDQPVIVTAGDKQLHTGLVSRTIRTLARTLAERGDPTAVFAAELSVQLAEPTAAE